MWPLPLFAPPTRGLTLLGMNGSRAVHRSRIAQAAEAMSSALEDVAAGGGGQSFADLLRDKIVPCRGGPLPLPLLQGTACGLASGLLLPQGALHLLPALFAHRGGAGGERDHGQFAPHGYSCVRGQRGECHTRHGRNGPTALGEKQGRSLCLAVFACCL